jgi:SAM-dependent methyltransferase
MVKTNDRILDVGTGKGQRITRLRQKGFKDITGTDIFIKDDIYYDDGLRVLKVDIRDIEDTFDFVMLNHVFEHMPEPLENLKILHKLVKPGKYLMIRIPVADSYSWEEYRTCWYQLDPPRHFYLHTRKSMQILAEEAGFRIDKVIDDSSEIQFIGSEQYKKGIASFAENSYFINPSLSDFSRKDISTFRRKAKKLNLLNEGDSRCFYLFRP